MACYLGGQCTQGIPPLDSVVALLLALVVVGALTLVLAGLVLLPLAWLVTVGREPARIRLPRRVLPLRK